MQALVPVQMKQQLVSFYQTCVRVFYNLVYVFLLRSPLLPVKCYYSSSLLYSAMWINLMTKLEAKTSARCIYLKGFHLVAAARHKLCWQFMYQSFLGSISPFLEAYCLDCQTQVLFLGCVVGWMWIVGCFPFFSDHIGWLLGSYFQLFPFKSFHYHCCWLISFFCKVLLLLLQKLIRVCLIELYSLIIRWHYV